MTAKPRKHRNTPNSVPGVPKKPTGKRHWRIPSELIDRALGLRGPVMSERRER